MPLPRYISCQQLKSRWTYSSTTRMLTLGGLDKTVPDTTFARPVGLSLGSSSSSATSFTGFPLSVTKTAVLRAHADDAGVALGVAAGTSVSDLRVGLGRLLITTDNSSKFLRVSGLMGHVKAYSTATRAAKIDDEQTAGVFGYIELQDAGAAVTLAGYGKTSAVVGCVENIAHTTVSENHVLGGVMAISKLTSDATLTGTVAGVVIDKYDTTNWSDGTARVSWPSAIYVGAADAVFKFASGTAYAAGVKVGEAGSVTAIGGATHVASGTLKVLVGSTAYYIPLYGAGELAGE